MKGMNNKSNARNRIILVFAIVMITQFFLVLAQDSTPPQYFDNSTNSTLVGEPTLFSLNWTDDVGLSGYVFSTNNTGTWVNDTWTDYPRIFWQDNFSTDTLATNYEHDDRATVTWSISGGTLYESDTDWTTGYCVYNKMNASDVIIEAEMKWSDNDHMGLVARFVNLSEYYIGDVQPQEDSYRIVRNSWNGTHFNSTTLATGDTPAFGTGTWYPLKFVVFDQNSTHVNLTLYFNNQKMASVLDADKNLTSGYIGVHQAANQGGYYDNLTAWNYFIGTQAWSNVTKTLNSTLVVIGWKFYANDTSNNWNASEEFSFVTTDETLPTFSNNATNNTIAGDPTLFSLNWTDNVGLSGYIFSFDNCTGSLVNDSAVAMTGTGNWSNVTKVINSTIGCTIQWRVYANDTSNN